MVVDFTEGWRLAGSFEMSGGLGGVGLCFPTLSEMRGKDGVSLFLPGLSVEKPGSFTSFRMTTKAKTEADSLWE
jgi:hypothetical protein